jgi:hypothetical protein
MAAARACREWVGQSMAAFTKHGLLSNSRLLRLGLSQQKQVKENWIVTFTMFLLAPRKHHV